MSHVILRPTPPFPRYLSTGSYLRTVFFRHSGIHLFIPKGYKYHCVRVFSDKSSFPFLGDLSYNYTKKHTSLSIILFTLIMNLETIID